MHMYNVYSVLVDLGVNRWRPVDHNSLVYVRQRLLIAKMAIIGEDMVLCGFPLIGGIE